MLRYWWQDHRLRAPAWDVTVHAYDPDADQEHEYEYLFSLYQLNWFEKRKFKSLMRATDRPHVITTEYCWR
jgi:hypothetical protein